jgi:hypothetical protein
MLRARVHGDFDAWAAAERRSNRVDFGHRHDRIRVAEMET